MRGLRLYGGLIGTLFLILILPAVLLTGGCRELYLRTDENLRQGDLVKVEVDADYPEDVTDVYLTVNGVYQNIPEIPYTFFVPTDKYSTNHYYTNLVLEGEATWSNGKSDTTNRDISLTRSPEWREDDMYPETYPYYLQYGTYVADDPTPGYLALFINCANRFANGFDASGVYAHTQHYYFEPRVFSDQSNIFVNNVDLVFHTGHGNPHSLDSLDLAETKFGGFTPAGVPYNHHYDTGDLEYLALAACLTLSDAVSSDGHAFWYYWFHDNTTQMTPRPFSGLHMVSGFRGNVNVDGLMSIGGKVYRSELGDFAWQFGLLLSAGVKYVDAWLVAASLSLTHHEGSTNNLAAVLYPTLYEFDTVYDSSEDRIHPDYGPIAYTFLTW